MQRPSLTGEPLLLHRGVLHRVDSTQLPQDAGAALGACKLPAAGGCTHDCYQGRACTCAKPKAVRPADEPSPDGPSGIPGATLTRHALQWVAGVAVFCVLAVAMLVMGKPQDH